MGCWSECKDWWGGISMINNWTGEPAASLLLPLLLKNQKVWQKKSSQQCIFSCQTAHAPPADLQPHPKKSPKSSSWFGAFPPGDAFLWVTAVNKWLKVGSGGSKRKPARRDGRRREPSSETVASHQWSSEWGGLKIEHPPALWDLAAPSCWQERTNRAEQRGGEEKEEGGGGGWRKRIEIFVVYSLKITYSNSGGKSM